MNERIRETMDYDKFQLHLLNREVVKVKRLEESMQKHGWIDAYPMHVVKNGNGKLYIKDGHHRFVVAKSLGIPVKYVVCRDNAGIHELQASTVSWTVRDYLQSYVRAGIPSYIAVKEYHEKTGIGVKLCVSMLSGELAASNNKTHAFKTGKFVLGSQEQANKVADIVVHCVKVGIKWANATLFVQALSRVSFLPEFDVSTFKHKVSTFPGAMEKQTNVQDYMDMIESVYNRQNRQRVPLRFLADEAAKNRNAVKPN